MYFYLYQGMRKYNTSQQGGKMNEKVNNLKLLVHNRVSLGNKRMVGIISYFVNKLLSKYQFKHKPTLEVWVEESGVNRGRDYFNCQVLLKTPNAGRIFVSKKAGSIHRVVKLTLTTLRSQLSNTRKNVFLRPITS